MKVYEFVQIIIDDEPKQPCITHNMNNVRIILLKKLYKFNKRWITINNQGQLVVFMI